MGVPPTQRTTHGSPYLTLVSAHLKAIPPTSSFYEFASFSVALCYPLRLSLANLLLPLMKIRPFDTLKMPHLSLHRLT